MNMNDERFKQKKIYFEYFVKKSKSFIQAILFMSKRKRQFYIRWRKFGIFILSYFKDNDIHKYLNRHFHKFEINKNTMLICLK